MFLDAEGAFDKVRDKRALITRAVDVTIVNWVHLLSNRYFQARIMSCFTPMLDVLMVDFSYQLCSVWW